MVHQVADTIIVKMPEGIVHTASASMLFVHWMKPDRGHLTLKRRKAKTWGQGRQ